MCVGFARWIIYLLCDTGSLFSEKGVYLCLLTGSSVVTLPLDHYALIKQISMELLQRWWSAVGLSVCAMLLGRTEKRGVREVCGMFSWEIVKKRHLHKAKWDLLHPFTVPLLSHLCYSYVMTPGMLSGVMSMAHCHEKPVNNLTSHRACITRAIPLHNTRRTNLADKTSIYDQPCILANNNNVKVIKAAVIGLEPDRAPRDTSVLEMSSEQEELLWSRS